MAGTMTPLMEKVTAEVRGVLDDYFPDPDGTGSLFIGGDEGRTKDELRVDLIAAVLEAMLP